MHTESNNDYYYIFVIFCKNIYLIYKFQLLQYSNEKH